MLLFTPLLLKRPRLEDMGFAVDGGADATNSGRIHLHKHVGQTACSAGACGTAFATIGGNVGRACADPVVDEEADVRVFEEVGGFS